jgi:BirA family biotin operon repressor/biotin-[acetyl-CoA-carboxylase] ligase
MSSMLPSPRRPVVWGGDHTADAIADLLAASPAHHVSGELIRKRLKLTRSAVWKAVGRLKREGYGIAASPHLGYRLDREPDVPLPRLIRNGLRARTIGGTIHAFRTVSSTNDAALAMAEEGCPDGTLVIAEAQTGGRGRLGRHWHSPAGSGLWFSVVLRPKLAASGAQALTFLGAVATARAVRDLHGVPMTLKWPNDLFLEGRKMGGVLTELSAESDLIRHAVIGIGFNVNLPAAAWPPELKPIATSLQVAAGGPVPRVPLLRRILEEMETRYAQLQRSGPASLVDEARALTPMIGKIVRIQHLGQVREGTVVGMDPDGALLLRSAAGTVERLLAGDVSILR